MVLFTVYRTTASDRRFVNDGRVGRAKKRRRYPSNSGELRLHPNSFDDQSRAKDHSHKREHEKDEKRHDCIVASLGDTYCRTLMHSRYSVDKILQLRDKSTRHYKYITNNGHTPLTQQYSLFDTTMQDISSRRLDLRAGLISKHFKKGFSSFCG